MSVYSAVQRTKPIDPPRILQALAALAAGLALFFCFILLWIIGFDIYYAGRIYPGVSVAGVSLDGLGQDEAAELLAAHLTYPTTGKIVFQDQEQVWVAKPLELGLVLDVDGSVQQAYRQGRSGNLFVRLQGQFTAWHQGVDLPPAMIYDQHTTQDFLARIAAQVNRPTLEAAIKVDGVDVVAVPGQVGRRLDIPASMAALGSQFHSLTDGLLPLVIEEIPPEILDASSQADAARKILSAPLTLQMPAGENGADGEVLGPWVIPPQQLVNMLLIERVGSAEGARYQLGLDQEALDTYLTALGPDIYRYPSNARFIFNDDTRVLDLLQSAVIGRSLNIPATIQLINETVMSDGHVVTLQIETIQPAVGDQASGEELGITELVIANSTYFRGSTTSRLQNIEMAAANFHGLLVPPGATFSMAANMGDVTLDNGYAEAWIIYGGRTIKGVGGGVCQVSTTLFRTVFFAGFPVVERHPHAYRVGYYEQTSNGYDDDLAGLDATVFVPMVDFKFINDTPYWLLMETYFNPTARRLTWKFYSTKDGRSVSWETTGPQNIVEPPEPQYEENPDLKAGEIKQVDWAAEGADVSVTRTVYRDGQALFSDIFNTHYMPWRDIYQYGPGTDVRDLIKKNKRGDAWWLALLDIF